MPFQSKAQMGAAFGGHLGPKMKSKARTWAHETPNIKSLPARKGKRKTSRAHQGDNLSNLARG